MPSSPHSMQARAAGQPLLLVIARGADADSSLACRATQGTMMGQAISS